MEFNFNFHFFSKAQYEALEFLLNKMIANEDQIMATLQEVKDALATAAATAAEEKLEVGVKLAELLAQIQALKDQIAAGTAATPADLDELLAAVNGITVAVEDITVPEVPAP